MHPAWIWLAAVAAYAVFSGWYWNWRGPLTRPEIDEGLAALERTGNHDSEVLATMRAFLEADDGREFLMVNLLRLHPGLVTPPGGGPPENPREMLERYSGPFLGALLRRAGHPAFIGAAAAGGYLEQWGVEKNPGWTAAAAIRYRSRRDMIELVNDPRFADAHAFKSAAIDSTLAFPTSPGFVTLGPRVWVALVLALVAALAQLALGRLAG